MRRIIACVAGLIFCLFVAIGINQAKGKPLWGDEKHSLLIDTIKISYGQILTLKIDEGNIAPLFYLIQKALVDVTAYQLPPSSAIQANQINDLKTQILLRLPAIIFWSFAVAGIFYFLSQWFSIWCAVFAIFLTISTQMVWEHWVEARPYALWISLTAFQFLLFVHACRFHRTRKKFWIAMTAINNLLALTVIFSIGQIVIVTALIWYFFEKRWKFYILSALLPIILCLLEYANAYRYTFYFAWAPHHLFLANFSLERLVIFLIMAIFLVLWIFQKKVVKEILPIFLYTLFSIFIGIALLLMFWLKQYKQPGDFEISNRYWIYLVPVSIISVSIFWHYLYQNYRQKHWLQWGMTSLFFLLTGMRFIKMFGHSIF